MKITWKDAVTTLGAGSAVVLERVYYNNYDWPLVSSTRWVVTGLAILGAITLLAGFAFDKLSSTGWDVIGLTFGTLLVVLTALGLIYAISDYVILIALTTVAMWVVSVAHHLMENPRAPRTLYSAM